MGELVNEADFGIPASLTAMIGLLTVNAVEQPPASLRYILSDV
jgi:hypothetical protein